MKFEILLWLNFIFKWIPGRTGCALRNKFMRYQHGKNVQVWEGVQIDKPSKLKIGDNVSINRGCVINAGGGISIGNNVLIGPNVMIYSQNHRIESKVLPFNQQGYNYKEVEIGDNVWLAANVIVLPGVRIGNNVVVAAGSVVTKDIPSNKLFGGTPAKQIKEL